jgi:hypothetical protein
MSEIASVVERTRKAFASISQLETALARNPADRALQLNLSAMRKMAAQSQEQLDSFARRAFIDLCKYRLVPEGSDNEKGYVLHHIARSFLAYQNLFTQIYDAIKSGKKQRAIFGKEAEEESALEFAYSYSGSLGIVLYSHSERNLLSGKLDPAIDSLYEVVDIDGTKTVREVAERLGNAVVKRVYDWSDVNVRGGFAADVRWNRSDGRQLGAMIAREHMQEIIHVIDATADSKTKEIDAIGILFGGNIGSRSFHFVVPGDNGDVYRGHLSAHFDSHTEMTLGRWYRAKILETEQFHYATEKVDRDYQLLALERASSLPLDHQPGA